MDLEKGLLTVIVTKFNLGEIKEYNCMKDITKLTTTSGVFAVKKMKVRPENFLYSYEAMEHLKKNGFNNVCEYVNSDTTEPFLIIGNEMYVVSKWLNGNICDYNNMTQLKTIAETLAKMHLASKGFKCSEKSQPRQSSMDWRVRFGSRCEELLTFKHMIMEKKTLTVFDFIYLNNIDYYYAKGINAIEMLDYTEYSDIYNKFKEEAGFCHHDIANHNVIMIKDEAYLIDFDYVYSDIFLHDLASLIIRNMKASKWNIEKAWYIVNCYSEVATVNEKDIDVMNQFISFPQDFWQIGFQYYIEKLKWTEEVFLCRLMRFIAQKEFREKFLSEFNQSSSKSKLIR